MRTPSPCYKCEHRRVGCHGDCHAYEAWLVLHGEEKDQERQAKYNASEVDGFLVKQSERVKKARHREYMREYARGRKR